MDCKGLETRGWAAGEFEAGESSLPEEEESPKEGGTQYAAALELHNPELAGVAQDW